MSRFVSILALSVAAAQGWCRTADEGSPVPIYRVEGAVSRSGEFPWTDGVTLWEAVVLAEPVEDRIDVAKRIEALPDRQREVLLLRYYQQMSEREIAEVVGIPQGTVKSRLHNAIRTLRRAEEKSHGGS